MTFTPSSLPSWQDADQDKQRTLREFLYRYAPADSVKRAVFEEHLCTLLNEITNEQRTTQADH